MSITDRIEQAPACEVINLTDDERALYTGAGWKLAAFARDRLVDFFDPMDIPVCDSPETAARTATDAALAWMAAAPGDVWLVMCSCGQLCEPRQILITDAGSLAHMVRVFGEQFVDMMGGD